MANHPRRGRKFKTQAERHLRIDKWRSIPAVWRGCVKPSVDGSVLIDRVEIEYDHSASATQMPFTGGHEAATDSLLSELLAKIASATGTLVLCNEYGRLTAIPAVRMADHPHAVQLTLSLPSIDDLRL